MEVLPYPLLECSFYVGYKGLYIRGKKYDDKFLYRDLIEEGGKVRLEVLA